MAAEKLRFLVDVSVGVGVTSYLREEGHDVVSVREIDPRAPDANILSTAVSENRIVVTMDKDFGELVYKSGRPHRGVLLLRMEEQDRKTKVRTVSRILEGHVDKLENHFCVYQNGRLRIRS